MERPFHRRKDYFPEEKPAKERGGRSTPKKKEGKKEAIREKIIPFPGTSRNARSWGKGKAGCPSDPGPKKKNTLPKH